MRFLAALVATLACVSASPSPYPSYPYGSYAGAYSYGPAHITVLPDGHLADTPEVAHAKGAHHLAKAYVAAAASADLFDSYSRGQYVAPRVHAAPAVLYTCPYSHVASYGPAHIRVLPSGYLADTPDVAIAKGAHHVAKSYAAVKSSYSYPYNSYHSASPASYGAHFSY